MTGKEKTKRRTPRPDKFVVGMRQAFYKGLSRECLDQSWFRLDVFRDSRAEVKLFHGKVRERRGITYRTIAGKLGRSAGELSRWFKGISPDWSNLLLVMTALDADWQALQPMAEKVHRQSAGLIEALQFVRAKKFGMPRKSADGIVYLVACLEALFSIPNWAFLRRIPARRDETLNRESSEWKIPVDYLDAADRDWGDAYYVWHEHYANSMDEEIWR